MREPMEHLGAFVRALRGAGLDIGIGQAADFVDAAATLGPAEIYWAGRVTLLARVEEIDVYDEVFARYWAGADTRRTLGEPKTRPTDRDTGGAPRGPQTDGVERGERARIASRLELLRHRDFSTVDDDDLRLIGARVARLLEHLPPRRSRRSVAAHTGRLDLRRTVGRMGRRGGSASQLMWRRRDSRPRRVVLLLDVSGSMSAYARAMLVVGHATARSGRATEVFCFATRLTRVTQELRDHDPSAAVRRAADAVSDWDSGTRIGGSIRTFIDRYGHAGMARGAIVLIVSDGLDVGDPDELREQMSRLRRLARQVIWLNPLKAQEHYEPLARGMAAALPSVDLFGSGHDLASLESLLGAEPKASAPLIDDPHGSPCPR